MELKTADSSYINPQEYIYKEEAKYPSSSGFDEASIYVPITQFEVTSESSDGAKLRALNERLNKGWYFIFKCFLFAMVCLDGLAVIGDLIYLVIDSFSHILVHMIILFLLAFETRQLLTLFKAIHYKDGLLAIKAVKLLTIYMLLAGIAIVVAVPMVLSGMEPEQREKMSGWTQVGIIVGALAIREITIYGGFMYGARKVRDRLQEMRVLQNRQNASTGRY